MDMGGWYGRDNSFRTMVDVQFVAAMGTPGGGRTFITDRYLRHYNLVALSQVRAAKKACSATMWRTDWLPVIVPSSITLVIHAICRVAAAHHS